MLLATAAQAADSYEVTKLQQDVVELQQLVHVQERKLELLERQLAEMRTLGPAPASGVRTPGTPATATRRLDPTQAPWLNLANWDRIHTGTEEPEVLQVLGVPNTVRSAPDGRVRTLLYAIELGTGGFLGGSVVLTERRVTEINKPGLR
jgi:hypothetical protein